MLAKYRVDVKEEHWDCHCSTLVGDAGRLPNTEWDEAQPSTSLEYAIGDNGMHKSKFVLNLKMIVTGGMLLPVYIETACVLSFFFFRHS